MIRCPLGRVKNCHSQQLFTLATIAGHRIRVDDGLRHAGRHCERSEAIQLHHRAQSWIASP